MRVVRMGSGAEVVARLMVRRSALSSGNGVCVQGVTLGATSRHRRKRDYLRPEVTNAEHAMDLLVNIDVDDLSKAIAFYQQAAGLRLGRRFGSLGVEMLGTSSAIYLLVKPDGTRP